MASRRPDHAMPLYRAQLASLVASPPAGDDWLHEQKFDGYRIGLRKQADAVELWSRRGREWTAEFPSIAAAATALNSKQALLDGEVAVVLPNGVTSFQSLQHRRAETPLTYFAFDLLYLDGADLRELPLEQRKQRLRELVASCGNPSLRYSDHVVGGGPGFYQAACHLGLEGIVSKKRDAPYRPVRNGDWQKTKCLHRQEFVIGGFTDPEGSREAIGALLVGTYEGPSLRWSGKVGTGPGWSGTYLRGLRRRLEALEIPRSPFDPPVTDPWLRRHAHWVRPILVAEVAFAEWTEDGRIRHASMQGLREDKEAGTVTRERPEIARTTRPRARTVTAPASRETVAGLSISHPERVVFPDLGITKVQVARYYEGISPWMVPHVAARPLTLLRCARPVDASAEKGGCEMMRHSKAWGPEVLRRVRIQELRKTGEYLVAESAQALVGIAQMDVVEVHTWNSRAETPYRHDRVVFDFDPGPAVSWEDVVAAGRLVRKMLAALGLRSWAKTTGGRGLHVVVPIEPADASACLLFARTVAQALVDHDPSRFTMTSAKAGRERQLLIDTLRNNRTNTSVAAYSLRARAGGPVSLPISWDELTPRLDPERFTIITVPQRLRRRSDDPWATYGSTRQALPGP